MAAKSQIEWTDATWNPVTGCSRISSGCAHCYAKTIHDMRHKAWLDGWKAAPPQYHVPFETVQTQPARLRLPLSWQKGRRIFVNSMSDLFHDDVPFEYIDKVFAVMILCPRHTFQILTKRPARMREWANRAWDTPRVLNALSRMPRRFKADNIHCLIGDSHNLWHLAPNVWLGVSVENQQAADTRIPDLLATPAAVRFLSVEPLLGPVDLQATFLHASNWGPRWVIVGGESGKGARPMHPDWARSLRDQCQAAGVPFFFKQWGEYYPFGTHYVHSDSADGDTCSNLYEIRKLKLEDGRTLRGKYKRFCFDSDTPNFQQMFHIGTKRAGRLLDGREWNQMPAAQEAHA